MPPPSVYLDECVDVKLADALRQRGFTAATARDVGMRGEAGPDQLVYATELEFAILTHNGRHLRRLHDLYVREGRTHGGILVIPASGPMDRLVVRAAMMLDWIATFPDYRSRLFQWGHLQDLLDRGLRLPGYTDADLRLARGRSE